MKRFYDDLRKLADQELRRCKMRCLSMTEHTAKTKSKASEEDSLPEKTVRAEVEVLKGQGAFSRDRLTVKLPFHTLGFDANFFDEDDYLIEFRDFTTTFVDWSSGNGYFSASGYVVSHEETGEIVARF